MGRNKELVGVDLIYLFTVFSTEPVSIISWCICSSIFQAPNMNYTSLIKAKTTFTYADKYTPNIFRHGYKMKVKIRCSWHTFMFTLYARKQGFNLISINFSLATNPATTWWTKPVTFRDILYKRKYKPE